jgi:nanoRNase/pAp phosphatase (c-di-AMP/oligoRNAs hydrolase)
MSVERQLPVVVMPRSEPDLDGVACAVSYAELLCRRNKSAVPWYPGTPDGEAQFVINQFPDLSFASEATTSSARSFVLVDASDLEGIPQFISPEWFLEIIDHRMFTDAASTFKNARVQIEPVGAAATLIVERFIKFGVTPSRTSAIMLYGAIYSNTLCLRGSITDERDKEAARWLEATGDIPQDWLTRQFAARREELLADIAESIHRERKVYQHIPSTYAVAQLEYGGAGKTVAETLDSLILVLRAMSPVTMLNMVDLEDGTSYVICPDADLRKLVAYALGVTFTDSVAHLSPALLRKQIVAAISKAVTP